jgi:hypothetical protein
MLRSYGELCHDYRDVIHLAEDLEKLGCPEETLFYLPGWNGPYDSTYPTYRPHPSLGGEEGFREMMGALHGKGFRVMIHTLGWGIDPYHPDIDRLIQYVRRDSEGRYQGYKIREAGWPPNRRLRFQTHRIPLADGTKERKVSFETVFVPDLCEGAMSLGGLAGSHPEIRVTMKGRSQSVPAGWFSDHEIYEFPVPFLLESGKNRVDIEAVGTAGIDWSRCWYRLTNCFVPTTPYRSSTCPILKADTADPGWIELFVEAVASVIEDFAIDAVHVDATVFDDPSGAKEMLLALRKRLPKTAIGGEWCTSLEDVAFWDFCQGATQSLTAQSEKLREPGGQGSLPVRGGLDERFFWLNKVSPVCEFVQNYLYILPHLCAANGFVPIGKVCDVYPKRLLYTDREELRRILKDSGRLGYMPALRVNYREYGLDEHAARFIREMVE